MVLVKPTSVTVRLSTLSLDTYSKYPGEKRKKKLRLNKAGVAGSASSTRQRRREGGCSTSSPACSTRGGHCIPRAGSDRTQPRQHRSVPLVYTPTTSPADVKVPLLYLKVFQPVARPQGRECGVETRHVNTDGCQLLYLALVPGLLLGYECL